MEPNRPNPYLRFALILAGLGIASVLYFLFAKSGDLPYYTKAASRLVAGEQIYRPDDPPAFTYPPFMALPFLPLVPFETNVQRFLWGLANISLLTAIIAILWQTVRPVVNEVDPSLRHRPAGFAIFLIALLATRFVLSPLEYQSNDLLVFLFVMMSLRAAAADRDATAGICAGLATALKATPLLFLPLFVWQRRWKAAAAFLAAVVAATILPDLLFRNPDGQLWAHTWYDKFVAKVGVGTAADAQGAWASWNLLNQSLSGTLYRLTADVHPVIEGRTFAVCLWPLSDPSRRIVTLALQLSIVSLIAVATRRRAGFHAADDIPLSFWERVRVRAEQLARSLRTKAPNTTDPLRLTGQFGAILCGMLLFSPMSSKQHFCTLLVPITFSVLHFLYRRRDPLVAAGLFFLLFLGPLAAKDILGKRIGDLLQAYGSVTLCTIFCLLITARALSQADSGVVASEIIVSNVEPAPQSVLPRRRR